MNKRSNWQEFEATLRAHGITKLYHFTDRDNLETIVRQGGLYSWKDCVERGIHIPKPAGAERARSHGIWTYARGWSAMCV